jgi:Xaa-Pro aminopeptidase
MADQHGSESHDPDFPEKYLEFMRTGWNTSAPYVATTEPSPAQSHERRRHALAALFPGETLVVPSGGEKTRANDTAFRFRPGSDHVWLTGEHDADAVLIVHADGEHVLYVRPRSSRETDEFFRDRVHGELWVGRRRTLREKSEVLGIRTAHVDELPAALDALAPGRTRVLRGYSDTVDAALRPRRDAPEVDRELARALAELRLTKDEWEIAQLQDAVDATVRGFEDVARVLPADRAVRERLLEGIFALRARHDGNDVGYHSIVGAGANATTLHWIDSTGTTRPGELLLMDMGVENVNLYTADVTRTVPVSGTFTPLQRQIYEIVYRSQEAGIAAVRPGAMFDDVHQACMRVLAEGLDDLGLLPVSVDEALKPDSIVYRRWSLHGSGHMLGLDVHDCAHARKERYREGSLERDYVITVEPGLYFQHEDELVPEELRGIGIRIEDDVLVTADGSRNLSAGLPRSPDEVEEWLAVQREAGFRLPG